MGDQRGGNGEGRNRQRGDARLEPGEDGEAADQFERPTRTVTTVGTGRPMLSNQPAVPAIAVSLP